MPSTATFNIFMDRRKPKSATGTDDLSAVKAAAWAWYQHGSGSNEAKPINEFLLTRTRQACRPSRYKLEAMRMEEECSIQNSSQSDETAPVTDNNSLLDAYEIASISKRLDYLIESGNVFFDRDNVFGDDRHKNSTSSIKKKNKNKKLLKGLWLRHAVVCGTREDVVTSAFKLSRPPSSATANKHVPVVKMAVCRPRAAHAL